MGYIRNISIHAVISRSSGSFDDIMDDVEHLEGHYDLSKCANVSAAFDAGSGTIDVDVEIFRSDCGNIGPVTNLMTDLKNLLAEDELSVLEIGDKLTKSDSGYYTGFRY